MYCSRRRSAWRRHRPPGRDEGYKVLAYYSAGEQHFQTRRTAIRTIADFKGLKMRVIQNKALVDGFRALGAVPAPLPYPEIYTALQQGTVDGTANDVLTVTSAKFYEVAKFFTFSSYVMEPRPVIMSKSYFDGLPGELQTSAGPNREGIRRRRAESFRGPVGGRRGRDQETWNDSARAERPRKMDRAFAPRVGRVRQIHAGRRRAD